MTFLFGRIAGLAFLAAGSPAAAQLFAVSASPPRFELTADPGHTIRNVVELENASLSSAIYTVSTADWTLGADGGVAFQAALAPGSCRSWVALEGLSISVPPRSRYRFRFEITPPDGTPPTECRFAILFPGPSRK